ncbi:MAG: hypothetical protein ACP5U2_13025 [Bryobacteraceae bacterium]
MEPGTPFDSIESAQQFVELLCETIDEARREVDEEIGRATAPGDERRKQALQLVAYNLAKLAMHMGTSRRILNDLRTLRRLLLNERELERATTIAAAEDELGA